MASSLILRRFLTPNILTRSVVVFCPKVAHGSFSSRSINTDGVQHPVDKDVRVGVVEIDCHKSIFRDVANTFRTTLYFLLDFHPTSCVNQLRNILNSMDVPIDGHVRTGRWNVMQSAQAVHLYLDKSGLADEDFSVHVERETVDSGVRAKYPIYHRLNYFGQLRLYRTIVNTPATLVFERKGRKGCEGEDDVGGCTFELHLKSILFINSAIKIEQNNQILEITLPKVKVNRITGRMTSI